MSISAADLKPLKTKDQKAHQAYLNDLGIGIGAEEAARRQAAPPKPSGQKPLYHMHFGQYCFWIITGRGSSAIGGPGEEHYGPTKNQEYFGSITRWITQLLDADKEELEFNQYAYLKDELQKQVQQFRDDAPHYRPVIEWLQEQEERADTYAELFSPRRYNVRVLVDARATRDLSQELNLAKLLDPEEVERLAYYYRIKEQRIKLAEQEAALYQHLQDTGRPATVAEQQRLAQLEKQIGFLALDQLDQLDMNRLQARATYKQDAANFKKGLKERLLQPESSGIDLLLNFPGSFQPESNNITGVIPNRIFFTLSELIREFDDNIDQYSTASSRAAYAAKQLALFDTNRPHVVQHFDRYLEMDALKLSALDDVLTELSSRYEQYQKRKLQSIELALSKPEIPRFPLQPYPFIPTEPSNPKSEMSGGENFNKLFINSFTPDNLTELLQYLEVVDSKGHCTTNELKGSGQGKRSKFTAAYRVLQREKLMDTVKCDAVWVDIFYKLYGAKLEEKAISHQLKPNGHPAAGCSKSFEQGVEKTKEWIKTWQESKKREV